MADQMRVSYSTASKGVTHTLEYFRSLELEYVTEADLGGNPKTGRLVTVGSDSRTVRYEGAFYDSGIYQSFRPTMAMGSTPATITAIDPLARVGFKTFRESPEFPDIRNFVNSSYGSTDAVIAAYGSYVAAIDAWEDAVNANPVDYALLFNEQEVFGFFQLSRPITTVGFSIDDLIAFDWIIVGSAFADTIEGANGNDTLTGGDGNDTITGGLGNDTIRDGKGANTLLGGADQDTLEFVYNSPEQLIVGGSSDRLDLTVPGFQSTASEFETIIIGALSVDATATERSGILFDDIRGDQRIIGSKVSDTFLIRNDADGGIDRLSGNGGADTFRLLLSSSGPVTKRITDFSADDRFELAPLPGPSISPSFIGRNAFNGTAWQVRFSNSLTDTTIEIDSNGDRSADQIFTLEGVRLDLESTGQDRLTLVPSLFTDASDVVDFRNLTSGQLIGLQADFRTGPFILLFPRAKFFDAGDGADTVTLPNSTDLFPGTGLFWSADIEFSGGSGNDVITGGDWNDKILGGIGEDRLFGGLGADTLDGGADNDIIYVGANEEALDDGGNVVRGGGGADKIFAYFTTLGGRPDTLYGGAEVDTFIVDTNLDRADIIMDFEIGESASDNIFLGSRGSFVTYSTAETTTVSLFDDAGKKGEFRFDGRIEPADLKPESVGLSKFMVTYEPNAKAWDDRALAEVKQIFDPVIGLYVAYAKARFGDAVLGPASERAAQSAFQFAEAITTNTKFRQSVRDVVLKFTDVKLTTAQTDLVTKEVIEQYVGYLLKQGLARVTGGDSVYDNSALDLVQILASVFNVVPNPAMPTIKSLIFLSSYIHVAIVGAMEIASATETRAILDALPDVASGPIQTLNLNGGKTSNVKGADNVSAGLGTDGRDHIYLNGDSLVLPENVEDGTLLDPSELQEQMFAPVFGAARVANATATQTDSELVGNSLNNVLTGNREANAIRAGAGNDRLDGRDGNDTLTGGVGADVFVFSGDRPGDDTITDFDPAVDRIALGVGRIFLSVSATSTGTLLDYLGGTVHVTGVSGLTLAQWNALVATLPGSSTTPAPTPTPTPPPVAQPGATAFFLLVPTGASASVQGTGTVFGVRTSTQQITVRDVAGTVTFDGSFNTGGDRIVLSGAASNYSVSRSGGTVQISDGDTIILVPVGAVGADIVFGDGVRSLTFDQSASTVRLGSQAITATAAQLTAAAGPAVSVGTTSDTVASQLIVNPGQAATVNGKLSVFGSVGGQETVIVSAGAQVILDGSYNAGGDRMVLAGVASSWTVSRSGATVSLNGPAGESVAVPVGRVGMTIEFADGGRTLIFDATAGLVRLGTQTIGSTPVPVTGAGTAGIEASAFAREGDALSPSDVMIIGDGMRPAFDMGMMPTIG